MTVLSARNQAEALVKMQGFTAPQIDVKGLAIKLGLEVIEAVLEPAISGLLITKPKPFSSCIAIRQGDSIERQRFSIGHELGHYCLGHQFVPGEHVHVDRGMLVSARGPIASSGTNAKEREANNFAASLLMPADMVHASVAKLNTQQLYDQHISDLAKEFGVSEQAMMVRLNILRIL